MAYIIVMTIETQYTALLDTNLRLGTSMYGFTQPLSDLADHRLSGLDVAMAKYRKDTRLAKNAWRRYSRRVKAIEKLSGSLQVRHDLFNLEFQSFLKNRNAPDPWRPLPGM